MHSDSEKFCLQKKHKNENKILAHVSKLRSWEWNYGIVNSMYCNMVAKF
jgi:hypothetical protein